MTDTTSTPTTQPEAAPVQEIHPVQAAPVQAAPPAPISATTGKPVPVWLQAQQQVQEQDTFGYPKSILLYGPPGTRKTSLASSLVKRPEKPTVLVLDADNGSEVIINDPELLQAKREGRLIIRSIDPTSPNAYADLCYILDDVATNDYGFDFFVVDTLNVIQKVVVEYLLATTFNSKGQLDTLAAWGEVGKWTDKIARRLHNAPHVSTIFVMHESVETEKTGSVSIVPKLQGSMKDSIASIPSIVAHLSFQRIGESENTELVANLGESDIYVTKNRYSAFLDTRMVDFSLLDLYARLDAHLNPTTNQAAVAA